jgi:hypothetical protein
MARNPAIPEKLRTPQQRQVSLRNGTFKPAENDLALAATPEILHPGRPKDMVAVSPVDS